MRKALIVFLAFTSLPLLAQSKEIDRTISVSGEAVIMVAPDQAVVTIGVETFDPSLEAASLTNDRIAKALIAEWKRLGVPDSRIQTSGVTVAIEYTRNNDHAKKIEGFVVSRSYDVTADSAATAERVITLGLA